MPGTRVVEARPDDGILLMVTSGAVVPGDDVVVATIGFLARGGGGNPFRAAAFTNLAVSNQQALVGQIADGLDGLITAAEHPEGGEWRITWPN